MQARIQIIQVFLLVLAAGSPARADDYVVRDNSSYFVRSTNEWGPSIVPRIESDGRDFGMVPASVVPADVPVAFPQAPTRSNVTESLEDFRDALSNYEPPAELPLGSEQSSTVQSIEAEATRLQSLTRGPQRIATFVEEQFSRMVNWDRSNDCSSGNCSSNDRRSKTGGVAGVNLSGIGSCRCSGGDCSCDSHCSDCDCGGADDDSCNVWDVGGWLAWGSYWNSHGINSSIGNSPLGFNNLAGPQLHQAWLYLAREAQTGSGFDWGFRIDGLFGTDGPDTQAFGDQSWDDSWDTGGQYGFAIPQLYGEVAFNKTRVKIGHFFTIIGYEVVQAPDNFFYSRPYTMYYNEPFTHTGFLAERSLTDTITTYAGWSAGWDTGFSNGNNGSVYLGGINWTPSDKLSTTYATVIGDPGDDPVLGSDTWMSSLVMDWTPNEKWEYVFQSDYQQRRSPVLGGRSYGINQYLFRTINDRLRIGMRYEWFREGRGANGLAGASDHFHALTFGLNRISRSGITVRPEMRYDWVDRDDAFAGGAFANGTKRSQFSYGLSAVKTF